MRPHSLLLLAALGLTACAPRALYFHETTKVAFAAAYNTSDSQPLATSFGYKRRIVAVVPSQERDVPEGGNERSATNRGEALSLVSKFNVRAGTSDGIVITNNFASGMAARIMTGSVRSPAALNVLLHGAPIEVSAATGETDSGQPAAQAVNDRLSRIMGKRTRRSEVPRSEETVDLDENDNLKTNGKKPGTKPRPGAGKKDPPASEGTVDLTPDGGIEIKKP